MNRRSLVFALPASLLLLAGCGFSSIHETVHRTVSTVPQPIVRVSNDVGAVRIVVWNKPQIDVVAVKDAHSTDDLRHVAIDVKSNGNTVSIATVNDGGAWGSGVGYTITVPAAASVDVVNGTGGIKITGVRGDVTARSTTGGLEANLGTVSGKRNVDMRVTTGGIDVKIARDSDATADLHAGVGGVRNGFKNDRIGEGTARIHLSTSVGGVSLHPAESN